MRYEWDPEKDRLNSANHGVDFNAIHDFEWETAVIEFDDRHGEPRWIARGFIGVVLHTVVFTLREDYTRIISLRRANRRERREYEQAH